jgi:hypothetical protein
MHRSIRPTPASRPSDASIDWTDALAACWPGTRYHADRNPTGHPVWTVPGNPRGIGPEPTAPRSAGLPPGAGGSWSRPVGGITLAH